MAPSKFPIPTDYQSAKEMLGDKDLTKIGNNTCLVRDKDDSGSISIMLHKTNIITFYRTGKIVFNTGGYQTNVTKDRMNRVLKAHGYHIVNNRGLWTICRLNSNSLGYDFYKGWNFILTNPGVRISF